MRERGSVGFIANGIRYAIILLLVSITGPSFYHDRKNIQVGFQWLAISLLFFVSGVFTCFDKAVFASFARDPLHSHSHQPMLDNAKCRVLMHIFQICLILADCGLLLNFYCYILMMDFLDSHLLIAKNFGSFGNAIYFLCFFLILCILMMEFYEFTESKQTFRIYCGMKC